MRVVMRTLSAGPRGVVRAGEAADVTKEEAELMLSGGYADLPKEAVRRGIVETAAVKPEETAAVRAKA